MALPRTILALACAAALAGCATPPSTPIDPAEQTQIEIQSLYGEPTRSGMPGFFAGKGSRGRGFLMSRTYGETGGAARFETTPPSVATGAAVLDIGVEMKMAGGFPLYRLALRPRNIAPGALAAWPAYVAIDREISPDTRQTLAARMPRDRRVDGDGLVWTEWTYCPDCFDLRSLERGAALDAGAALAGIDAAETHALALSGSSPAFVSGSAVFGPRHLGFVEGAEAFAMAREAGAIVLRARARVADALPHASAYRSRVEAFEATLSPVRAIWDSCGDYQPSSKALAVSQIAAESERFQAWETCADRVMDDFDASARQAEIAEFARAEARLAQAAGLTQAQRRGALSFETEMEQARQLGLQANGRFQAHLRALEKAGRQQGAMNVESAARGGALVAPDEFTLGGNVLDGLSQEARRRLQGQGARGEPNAGPPLEREIFVTRLMRGGANLETGPGREACAVGLECEIGMVEALIAVMSYCAAEGGSTRTSAGWGLVVQRYLPKTRDEELRLMKSVPGTHAISTTDRASLDAAIAAMEAERLEGGGRAFYRNYMEFYAVNNDERGCKDDWRDSARNKVQRNG